jgi:hypothetical protein
LEPYFSNDIPFLYIQTGNEIRSAIRKEVNRCFSKTTMRRELESGESTLFHNNKEEIILN